MTNTIFEDERLGCSVPFGELESLDFFDLDSDTLYDIEYEEKSTIYVKIRETEYNAIDILSGKLSKFSPNTAVRPLKARITIEGLVKKK